MGGTQGSGPTGTTPEAELRPITVMFCDLVGSTALSEQLDPEELLEVIQAYQGACRGIVERHEGYVAQYLGDGVLVYFGYPHAHDNDVQRSVRAGLEIVRAIPALNGQLSADVPPLHARIGIHTGPVVAGAVAAGSNELLALGKTPNVAARLQELAAPDTVVLSGASQRLVEGFFSWSALGTHTLKGSAESIEVHRALAESSVQTPFELAIREGLRPLVGRSPEIETLRHGYREASAGRGQIVRLCGDGGIGKSRLLYAFREDPGSGDGLWVSGHCSPHGQNTALHPVIAVLRGLLGFRSDDAPGDQLAKLEDALGRSELAAPENTQLLANLLSLERGEDAPPLMISPELQRARTLEALQALLVHASRETPLVVTFEDLHWVDPSSLEFLTLLADRIVDQRILLLLSYRPTFTPEQTDAPHVTDLALTPLTEEHGRAVIRQVAGGKSLPGSVVERIVERADGVPLFAEELTKMVLESESLREVDGAYELVGSLQQLSIPATLESSLRTRLDRLPDVKPVVQLAAVLGREFSHEMLESTGVLDGALLERGLRALVSAELLSQTGIAPTAHYSFRHALIQDAAYQSLLKRTRREYHGRIAETAVMGAWNVVSEQPEFVAHHFTEAALHEQAVEYWERAGRQALGRSANAEAIAHFTRGLEVVEALPDDRARWQHELALTMGQGPALNAARGYAAPEVERTYNRALELCEKIGDAPELFWVVWGLGAFYQARGQHEKALEQGWHNRRLAESQRALQAEAHFGVGTSSFYLGRLDEAREELEKGSSIFAGQLTEANVSPTGHHAGVVSLVYLSIVLWHLGHPDQARARCEEGVALARRIAHPYILFTALHWGTLTHYLLRDRVTARAYAEEASALSAEYGFPFGEATSGMTLDWVRAREGDPAAIEALQAGIAAYRSAGLRGALTHFLSLLADACGAAGRVDDGLLAVGEALQAVEQNGERCWEAELLRMRGELIGSREPDEAARSFEKALSVARSQRARSFELRSALGLARLWRSAGRTAEAHKCVADAYSAFEEGFETPDLKDASRLLDELSAHLSDGHP